MKRTLSIAIISSTLLGNPAQAYLAENGVRVGPLSGDQFVVEARPGMGAPSSWCAAGDFAIRQLNLAPNTKIWRVSEPPRKSGEDVVFSLSPAGAASKTGLAVLGAEGAAISAGFAQTFCDDPRIVD